jgi:C4-dicarboxylate transporter DctM subunit
VITPPFGVNLFAAFAVAKTTLDKIIVSPVPFVCVVLGCVLTITCVPALS